MMKAEDTTMPTTTHFAAGGLAKMIRVLTIAPVMALLTLTLLFRLRPAVFHGALPYVLSLLFLVALPVLGYPLQPFLPYFKHRGREGQRNLAMLMAMLGYIAGLVYAVAVGVTIHLLVIYLTYFLSGVGVFVFNKLFHIRASGHACGVAGPVALLVYFFGAPALGGLLLLALVFYASLQMKRHTLAQLIIGSFLSVCALLVSAFLVYLFH